MMWSLLTCTMTFASFAALILTAQTGALSHFNEKRLGARLGKEVIIPCTDHHEVNHLNVFRWFYRRNSQESKRDMIFQNNKAGLNHINSHLWGGKKILPNFSLVIMNFKEEDQGVYSCEICPGTEVCTKRLDTSLLLIRESPPAVPKRVYAAAGGNFTHPCPGGAGGLGPSASWTFRRFGEPSPAPWSHQRGGLQPNGSIFIPDVQASDAGTYSCVRGRNSDLPQTQTLLALSLCVLTAGPVGSSVSRGSPLTCSVHCDVSPEPVGLPGAAGKSSGAAAVVVETGSVTFQVRPGEREGTVVCYANETGESGVEDSTLHLDTENNQEDATPLALFFCVSLASGFCTLAIFLGFMFLCRRRLIAAFPTADEPSGDVLYPKRNRDTTPEMGEAETQIIYSVLEIKQPEKDRVLVREDGCVYSTIRSTSEFKSSE